MHDELFYNFLFADGHVEILLLEEIHETGSGSHYYHADKMWSRQLN